MAINISPPQVKVGVLDKDAFRKIIPILAARVPVTKLGEIRTNKMARQALLQLPRQDPIVPSSERKPETKLMLLASDKEEEIDPEALAFIKERATEIITHNMELTYDFWEAYEILEAILPVQVVVPTSYTSMGHIIHLNLRSHQLPYKYIIGEVFLSKRPNMRTVVNKTDRIHAQYRYFEMELLAGEPDFMVEVTESKTPFVFDYREVYFNTRLGTEHDRIVANCSRDDLVCDVMGGVGPFAIPAAAKGCAVMMNDLNPNAIKWAKVNVERNHVEHLVRLYEMDGVDFIRNSVIEAFKDPFPPYAAPLTRRQREQKEWIAKQKAMGRSGIPRRQRRQSRGSEQEEEQGAGSSSAADPLSQLPTGPPQSSRGSPGQRSPVDLQTSGSISDDNSPHQRSVVEASGLDRLAPSRSTTSPSNATNGAVLLDSSNVSSAPSPAATRPITTAASPFRTPISLPPIRNPDTAPERRTPAHYILNLPSTALLFLFAFRGFLRPLMETHEIAEYYSPDHGMPLIHVYCFTAAPDEEAQKKDILERASNALNYPLTADMPELEIYYVRKVSPTNHGWCLSFRLPWQVAVEQVSDAEIRHLQADLVKVHEAMESVPEEDDYDETQEASHEDKRKRGFPKVDMM